MEFLDCSRSARKMDPSRTVRYRRADPRGSSIVLGFDRDRWETTNNRVQNEVKNGIKNQGKYVKGERRMTSSRKRGMLESTLSFGNAINEWKTESGHYHSHDLRSWGPRSMAQQDSYAWTDADRRKLTTLRDAKNAQVAPEVSHYTKLPPIYARHGGHVNGHQTDMQTSNGDIGDQHVKPRGSRRRRVIEEEDDI